MDDHLAGQERHRRSSPGRTESGSQALSTPNFLPRPGGVGRQPGYRRAVRLEWLTVSAKDDATKGKATDEATATGDRRSLTTRWFFPDGEEPDPRFTLANERTFLAWMRTALAFVAGGVGIEALPDSVLEPGLRTFAALAAIGTGVLLAAGSAVRWLRIERAMRHDKPLPAPSIVPALSAGAILAAVILALLVIG